MSTDKRKKRLETAFRNLPGETRSLKSDAANALALEAGVSLLEVEAFALERGIVPEKYGRNMGTLGLEGQRRLLGSRIVVVGLGGLGGHVVEIDCG